MPGSSRGARPAPPTGWNVSAGSSVSGTHAADLALVTNTAATLVRAVGVIRNHLKLTAMMKVVKMGDGELDLINIVTGAEPGAPGLHLTHNAGGQFAVEPPGGAPTFLAATFAEFVLVQLEVDVTAGSYTYAIGQETGGGSLNGQATATSIYVSVGASFTSLITKAWHVRFDDITVDAR